MVTHVLTFALPIALFVLPVIPKIIRFTDIRGG